MVALGNMVLQFLTESSSAGVLTPCQAAPMESQMLMSCPVMSPKAVPLRLAKGSRIDTRVKPNMGPMQAPKRIPPVLMSDPKLLQSRATPVAMSPNPTDRPRRMKASLLSDTFWKQVNVLLRAFFSPTML